MGIEEWLIRWLADHSDAGEAEIRLKPDANYFAEGWMDSLNLIELICDAEEHFQIDFSNEDFQNRSFSTVRGLANIIAGKTAV